MHLHLITRGIKPDVDRFITQLQGKYLPFKWRGQDKMIEVAVRPIQIWEIIFPEEHLDMMMNTIFSGADGTTQQKKHRKWITAIRKILGVEPLPKEYKKDKIMPIYKENIEMIGVGIKKDKPLDDPPTEGL